VRPINATDSTALATDSDGRYHLEGIKEHFLRQDQFMYTYEGISQVRDVDTESWISQRNNEPLNSRTNFTGFIQVFYTSNWNIVNGFNGTSNMSVPWRVVLDGNFTYRLDNGTIVPYTLRNEYNMLEFQVPEPDYDPFDASICFGVNQFTLLRLTLPLPDGTPYTSIDHSLLRTRIRLALSQATNISPTRLAGINVSIYFTIIYIVYLVRGHTLKCIWPTSTLYRNHKDLGILAPKISPQNQLNNLLCAI